MITPKLVATIAVICLGSFQFGYHMAELNSPESILSCAVSKPGRIPYEQSWFGSRGFSRCIPLTTSQVGMVTSIFGIGGLVGSLYIGSISDKFGRKRASLVHCLLYLIGSTLNGTANGYWTIVFGRFIAGLGAGAALVITSIFINEIAPTNYKGAMGAMNQASVNLGILFTQLLALAWCDNNQWRKLLLMGSVVGLVDFFAVLFIIDESPMWLATNGHTNEAFTIIHKLRGGDYTSARNEVKSWRLSGANGDDEEAVPLTESENSQESQAQVPLKKYLTSREYNNSKVVGTGVLVLQQFCGINSIIFYGVSVLVSIFPNYAIMINCLISVVNVVVTFAAAPLVDRLGRKPLLLTSVSVMAVSTILMGFGIIGTNSVLSIVGTFAYITFFALGLGPIPFLIVSEVTQPTAKASAQSWGMTMNWLATFVVGFLFPLLKNSWIGGGVYFIFTFMCVVAFLFVKKYVPETKGTSSYDEVWKGRQI
ncbi:putative metabolite transport protein [Meyerozyma sp. JA9]|nr:putative metabolite transport protein [Meyerozyma sp. JA9]